MPDAHVDPVAEPAAYQALLLSLLAQDDPATVQSETPAALRGLVAVAGEHLRVRPEPGEWSVLEVVAHVVDAEIVCAARYRWIVAHEEPELIGYDQDLWVSRLRHNDDPPEEILSIFDALRAADVAFWGRTPAEERARSGLHSERGPETFDLLFRMMAGHDRFHLDQARKTLAAVRGARTGTDR